MRLSLEIGELSEYVSGQLNVFFPDRHKIQPHGLELHVRSCLQRLDFCFSHVSSKNYFDGKESTFNHLFGDHYIMFLWFLSNTVYKDLGKNPFSDKLYLLNKHMFSFDCMYDTKLPDIFLIFHGMGTMLGKATYGDFFVALHGCTVGSHKGNYPVIGKGVSLTANSSIIGNCRIGSRVSISANTHVFEKNIADDTTVFINNSGKMEFRESNNSYAQSFFNHPIIS